MNGRITAKYDKSYYNELANFLEYCIKADEDSSDFHRHLFESFTKYAKPDDRDSDCIITSLFEREEYDIGYARGVFDTLYQKPDIGSIDYAEKVIEKHVEYLRRKQEQDTKNKQAIREYIANLGDVKLVKKQVALKLHIDYGKCLSLFDDIAVEDKALLQMVQENKDVCKNIE